MTRRELLAAACAWTAGVRALAQHPGAPHVSAAAIDPQGDADITLRIAETTVDIGPRRAMEHDIGVDAIQVMTVDPDCVGQHS